MPLFRKGGATVGLRTRLRAERDQGGSIFIGRFVEAIRDVSSQANQAGCFVSSLVEMAFAVGQGMVSLLGSCSGWKVSGLGVISPR